MVSVDERKVMKVTDKGPVDVSLPQLIRNDRTVSSVREKAGKGLERSGEAAQVTISADARRLQRVAALAKRGDKLRTEKVNRIKEQILQGEYHIEAAEVAKGIARSEISRLLGGRAINDKS